MADQTAVDFGTLLPRSRIYILMQYKQIGTSIFEFKNLSFALVVELICFLNELLEKNTIERYIIFSLISRKQDLWQERLWKLTECVLNNFQISITMTIQ